MDSNRPARRLRPLGLILGSTGVVATLLVVAFAAAIPIPPPSGTAHLRIESLRHSPPTPGPSDAVTVTATVVGVRNPEVVLGYVVHFGNETARIVTMARLPNGDFAVTLGPFSDGSDVWYALGAFSGAFGPVITSPGEFHVGTPAPSGLSSLALNFVRHQPDPPQFFSSVTVSADATSNATIQSVILGYVILEGGRNQASTTAMPWDGIRYSTSLPTPGFFGPSITQVVTYRVSVRDEAGSRVLSEIRTYTVRAPLPVP